MNTKTILAIGAFVLFFATSKLTAQTVYITESGKKYHAKNCDIVKTGKKGIDLAEAKKKGLEPCKACKVESEPKVADKPKTIETKKK
jgi:NOL1/NOP2/fmu family ribosome biogenesis protein